VTAVLDKLGIGSVIAIGHSMGGEVATALAEADPSRIERLVLIDSPPKAETTFKLGTRLALMPVLGELLSRFMSDPEDAGARLRAGVFRAGEIRGRVKQLTYTAFRTAHNDSMAYETEKPVVERLAALNPVPPLLVIFGSQDALVAPESAKLFEPVPGAKVVVLDGPGHSPMVEAPEKTLALIEDFLARPE
jgi:pimeloyl-ACP methyl ester carboxylesterase